MMNSIDKTMYIMGLHLLGEEQPRGYCVPHTWDLTGRWRVQKHADGSMVRVMFEVRVKWEEVRMFLPNKLCDDYTTTWVSDEHIHFHLIDGPIQDCTCRS